MNRRPYALLLVVAIAALPVAGFDELDMQGIAFQYPDPFTKVVAANLALISADEALNEAVLGPLAAANHPLNGILRSLRLLELDVAGVVHAAYATGPGMTPYSLVEGVDTQQALEAVDALQEGVGTPDSSYQNWDVETIADTPVVITGGRFGPFQMQWCYFAANGVFWIGSEIGLIGLPDLDRLRLSTESILSQEDDAESPFDELLAMLGAPYGDICFVRLTDPSIDRPFEAGEGAMGYAATFDGTSAAVRYIVRFASTEEANAAADKIAAGTSSYLAQDLYHGELTQIEVTDETLRFEVTADLPGIVGLLMLTVPIV